MEQFKCFPASFQRDLCARVYSRASPGSIPVAFKARDEDLPLEVRASSLAPSPAAPTPPEDEGDRIRTALASAGGNRSKAARELGTSRATLYRRLRQLGIDRD